MFNALKTLIYLIQYRVKNRPVKKVLRKAKVIFFQGCDQIGEVALWALRYAGLLPQAEKYSKDKVKTIVIIKTNRIGDLLLSTPAVRAIRESFPAARIVFVTTPWTKDLMTENRDIDELFVVEDSLLNKIKFVKRLKTYKFDLAVCLGPYLREALLAFLSGAVFRVGYPEHGRGFLLTAKIPMEKMYQHEIESSLDVVRAIGADTQNKKPNLPISESAQEHAERLFEQNSIHKQDLVVGIHPGAFEKYRRWSKKGFAEVADAIISTYKAKVIIFGRSQDKDSLDVLRLMREKPALSNLSANLQELAALIKRCDVFLGNMSGPVQIAAAVGTRVVAISGPTRVLDSEEKFAPPGEGNCIVRKDMDCPDCHPGHCRDYECLSMITSKEVLDALTAQITKTGKSSNA